MVRTKEHSCHGNNTKMVKWKRKCCHMAAYHPWPWVHRHLLASVLRFFWVFTALEFAIRYCASRAEGRAKAATPHRLLYPTMTRICIFEQIFLNQSCLVNTFEQLITLLVTSHSLRVTAGMKSTQCWPWVHLFQPCFIRKEFFFRFTEIWALLLKELAGNLQRTGVDFQ